MPTSFAAAGHLDDRDMGKYNAAAAAAAVLRKQSPQGLSIAMAAAQGLPKVSTGGNAHRFWSLLLFMQHAGDQNSACDSQWLPESVLLSLALPVMISSMLQAM